MGKGRLDGSTKSFLQKEQVKLKPGKLYHLKVNYEHKDIGNNISESKVKPTKSLKSKKTTGWHIKEQTQNRAVTLGFNYQNSHRGPYCLQMGRSPSITPGLLGKVAVVYDI